MQSKSYGDAFPPKDEDIQTHGSIGTPSSCAVAVTYLVSSEAAFLLNPVHKLLAALGRVRAEGVLLHLSEQHTSAYCEY